MSSLYIGLMSGTSTDGVDGLLLDAAAPQPSAVQAFASIPFTAELRAELLALNQAGHNELHRAALAGNALARDYAQVVEELLRQTGLNARQIRAIGAHGQTVRHQPQLHDGTGYTLQINQPALLAELTGISVVADFRSRDLAAGGQGAPLAPFFHQAWFGAQGSGSMAVLNIGGISNVSLLNGDKALGFDCGPGNVLMDGWTQQHLGQPFDDAGNWAATGQVHAPLLASQLQEPYFAQPAPKSTGRDVFNAAWLQKHLQPFTDLPAQDVQATLLELTARSIVDSLAPAPEKLIVCGGGAYNRQLMLRLQTLMPHTRVESSQHFGLAPNQVEAAAFAWLAAATIEGRALPLPRITGARAARVLGCIYPA